MFEHPAMKEEAFISELGRNAHFQTMLEKEPQKKSQIFCQQNHFICKDSKYRTVDGTCNNLNKPYLGMSNVGFYK